MAKTKFTTKENDGTELKLAILHPTDETITEANAVQNKVFREAVNSGALLGLAIDKALRDQGLWDDEKQKKIEALAKEINDARYRLSRGGMKKSEGKDLAMQILEKMGEQRRILSERSVYSSRTADGQADNARFNYLVYACTVDDAKGEKVFVSQADYEAKANTEKAAAAANCLAEVMFGIGTNAEANNVEYKFLKRFGYVNDKLQFVNEKGQLVDRGGRRINEEGRFIDDDGNFVDINGHRVDENGDPIVEELPFLDDDGSPIDFPAEKEEETAEELVTTE